MDGESDPRIYFAGERTLLAWLRTGIAVIGLGFLVARFGVFLMIARGHVADLNQTASSLIGISFVVLGTLMIAVSTWQHWRFTQQLTTASLPRRYSTSLSLWISGLIAFSGLALTVYLLISIAIGHPVDAVPGVRPVSIERPSSV